MATPVLGNDALTRSVPAIPEGTDRDTDGLIFPEQSRWKPYLPGAPMTRTTRPDRKTKPTEQTGITPRPRVLKPETYDQLPEHEQQLHDLLHDLVAIIDARQCARLDVDSIGFPTDYRLSDSNARGGAGLAVGWRRAATGDVISEQAYEQLDEKDQLEWTWFDEAKLNAVEAAAVSRTTQRAAKATDFLAETAEAIGHLRITARTARRLWPSPPVAGTKIHGITVGAPGSDDTETCAWCDQPAISGTDPVTNKPLIRRVDGHAVHFTPCYWSASNEARATGKTVTAVITERVTNLPTEQQAS